MTSKKLLGNVVLAIVVPLVFAGLSILSNLPEVKVFFANAGLSLCGLILILRVIAPIGITSIYILSNDRQMRSRLETSGIQRFFLIDDSGI